MRILIAVGVLFAIAGVVAHGQKDGGQAPITFRGQPVKQIKCGSPSDDISLDCEILDDGTLYLSLLPKYPPKKQP